MIKRYLLLLVFLLMPLHAEPIEPIPLKIDYDRAKAALGKRLFYDARLSRDGTIACVSYHILPGNGADNTPFSHGIGGAKGSFNSPTVLNAVFNFSQFWDGRANNLAEQIHGPISNPDEMGISMPLAVEIVKEDTYYVRLFQGIYEHGVTQENLADAIAEFERALITPNARFDRYLRGDKEALNAKELEGYKLFKKRGCISCHNGVNIGGNMYQKSGIFALEHVKQHTEHFGRYNVTKKKKDIYYFKVPSLRNVALTAPYFHDGAASDLKTAVSSMMHFQLGIEPDMEEVAAIGAFLETLTGETPEILLSDAP